MTEKRFTIKEFSTLDAMSSIDVICDNGIELPSFTACNLLNELSDENVQLKSTIKEVTELLSEEVDLFSDKATEHDINAYVELKELDNKDAFYMATATKKAIRRLKELQE